MPLTGMSFDSENKKMGEALIGFYNQFLQNAAYNEYVKGGGSLDALLAYFGEDIDNGAVSGMIREFKSMISYLETLARPDVDENGKKAAFNLYKECLKNLSMKDEHGKNFASKLEEYKRSTNYDTVLDKEVQLAFSFAQFAERQLAGMEAFEKKLDIENSFNIKKDDIERLDSDIKSQIRERILSNPNMNLNFVKNYEANLQILDEEKNKANLIKSEENIKKESDKKIESFEKSFDSPENKAVQEVQDMYNEINASCKETLERLTNENNAIIEAEERYKRELAEYNKKVYEIAKQNTENNRLRKEHEEKLKQLNDELSSLKAQSDKANEILSSLKSENTKLEQELDLYTEKAIMANKINDKLSMEMPDREHFDRLRQLKEKRGLFAGSLYDMVNKYSKSIKKEELSQMLRQAIGIVSQKNLLDYGEDVNKLNVKLGKKGQELSRKGVDATKDSGYLKLRAKYEMASKIHEMAVDYDGLKVQCEDNETLTELLNHIEHLPQKVDVYEYIESEIKQLDSAIQNEMDPYKAYYEALEESKKYEGYTNEGVEEKRKELNELGARIDTKIKEAEDFKIKYEATQRKLEEEDIEYAKKELKDNDEELVPPTAPEKKVRTEAEINEDIKLLENQIREKHKPNLENAKNREIEKIKSDVRKSLVEAADNKISQIDRKKADMEGLKKDIDGIYQQISDNDLNRQRMVSDFKKEIAGPNMDMYGSMEAQLQLFKEHIEDCKGSHKNSKEFNEMHQVLNELFDEIHNYREYYEKNSDMLSQNDRLALEDEKKSSINTKLEALRDKSQFYFDEKQKGIHWFPNKMRQIRLDMAIGLRDFAKDSIKTLENDTFTRNLANGYVERLNNVKHIEVNEGSGLEFFGKLIEDKMEQKKKEDMLKTESKTAQNDLKNKLGRNTVSAPKNKETENPTANLSRSTF